jgi:hypothetical protein
MDQSKLKALQKVEFLQNSLKNSNFLTKFFPKSFYDISQELNMSPIIKNTVYYRSQAINGFDHKCFDEVLLDPVWDVLDRPSKCIRAMLVQNFNQLAKIQDEQHVLYISAFIEILHSLTLIIGIFHQMISKMRVC